MDVKNKWPSTLLEMMEVNRRVLAAAGISEDQVTELAYRLTREYSRNFGGLQTYIPKGDQLDKAIRDDKIFHEYKQGNADQLSRRYNLSEVQIYTIYKQQYKLRQREIQPQLFTQ